MPALTRLLTALLALAAMAFWPGEAAACTTATANTDLGRHSSYAVGTTPQAGSGSAGLQCDILLAALTPHYVALRVDSTTGVLTGPTGQTIPFITSLTPGGAAVPTNSFINLSSLSIVSLFAGANGAVPLYFRTTATTGLRAGTYSGHVDLRWYYSVCQLGVAVCLAYSNSPALIRPLLGAPTDWGTGAPVRVNVQLIVENDCIITAPNANFGSAPLVGSFNPVTRTILIRCSAGAAYTVGLNDGNNALGNVRRMRNGSNYLNYEIFKTASSNDRWGSVGSQRRSSVTADTNPNIYDSVTTQGYTYRAAIAPGQITPAQGTYTDTIRIDVQF